MTIQSREAYIVGVGVNNLQSLIQQLNFAMQRIADRLDMLEGVRGVRTQATIYTSPIYDPLTATRLVQTGATKAFSSVTDLTEWIAGSNCTVADDGDGSITITIGVIHGYVVDGEDTVIHEFFLAEHTSDTHGYQ
jgi:hypothetical protein